MHLGRTLNITIYVCMCVCVFSLFACLLFVRAGLENRGLPFVSLGVVNEPTAALGSEAWQLDGPAIGSHGWAPPAEPRRLGRARGQRLEVAVGQNSWDPILG